MTDPMQLLEMPLDAVEPPADFAAELRARLVRDLGATRHRRRMRAGAAGAIAGGAAIAGVLALPRGGDGDAGLVVVAVTPSPRPSGPLPTPVPGVAPPTPARSGGPAAVVPQSPDPVGPARSRASAAARDPRPRTPGVPLEPMSYADAAHDGYAPYTASDGNPRPEVSDPAVDLLKVEFTPLAARHFRISITLGAAPKAATQYIAESDLSDDCYVYWMLTPGTLAEWILFCDAQPIDRTQTRGQQGAVTVEGATISAEFDLSDPDAIPEVIHDAPVLGHSFARACPDTGSCTDELTYDEARAPAGARFRWR